MSMFKAGLLSGEEQVQDPLQGMQPKLLAAYGAMCSSISRLSHGLSKGSACLSRRRCRRTGGSPTMLPYSRPACHRAGPQVVMHACTFSEGWPPSAKTIQFSVSGEGMHNSAGVGDSLRHKTKIRERKIVSNDSPPTICAKGNCHCQLLGLTLSIIRA